MKQTNSELDNYEDMFFPNYKCIDLFVIYTISSEIQLSEIPEGRNVISNKDQKGEIHAQIWLEPGFRLSNLFSSLLLKWFNPFGLPSLKYSRHQIQVCMLPNTESLS